MPGREIPLVSGQIYHVFNRGVGGQLVFVNKRDCGRFLNAMFYYQNEKPSLSYSKFLSLSTKEREQSIERMMKMKKWHVEILGYCLMPNHFHLVLRQLTENGIATFISNLTNSYTRYLNTKSDRDGPLFKGKFKAVLIEDDEQLLHVVRYIHINPYTSYIVKTMDKIATYPYSSFAAYMEEEKNYAIETETVLSQFKTKTMFQEFTYEQADYQRSLQNIKHLALES